MTQTPLTLPRDKVRLRRSPVFTKRPLITDLEDGEIAVNFHADEPGLFIRDADGDGNYHIRKIGPIHFSSSAPNLAADDYGFPTDLSNGECWIDTSSGDGKYLLKVWKGSTSQWITVGEVFGRKDANLDQFLNGGDGEDFIHTDGIRLKINNKTALAGLSSSGGNRLIINENDEFANGLQINGRLFTINAEELEQISNDVVFKPHEGYTFTTDGASGLVSTVFSYISHGLFNGEKIFVFDNLSDGTTPSPVAAGEYFVSDATNDTFKLKTAEGSYVNSAGNIYISYSPEIVIDRDRNVLYAGNLGLKSVDDVISTASDQLSQNAWDVFHNPTNNNVRVFARVGNDIQQIQTSITSIDVKSGEATEIIRVGDPVFYVGSDLGTGLGLVKRSKSLDDETMLAIGVASASMQPGQRGSVTLLGTVTGINTTSMPGKLPGDVSNVGRVVFVAANGGLTLTTPNTLSEKYQAMGVLISDTGSVGTVVVNHPSSFVSLPNLPADYVWVGGTNDEATAHRLSPSSFKRTYNGLTQTWTLSLADNLEFGAYKFSSDGSSGSKIETFVDSTQIPSDQFVPIEVETFSTSYRSAKYIVQISGVSADGTFSPVFQVCELLVIHNNIQAFVVEYGTVSTYNDERLGQFDAKIEASSVILTFQKFPLVTESVGLKSVRTSILV